MDKEVEMYFIERYRDSLIKLVPDLWPKFKTKEEVDHWIGSLEKIFEIPPVEGPAVFCDSGHCRFTFWTISKRMEFDCGKKDELIKLGYNNFTDDDRLPMCPMFCVNNLDRTINYAKRV